MILAKAAGLRDGRESNFRSYTLEVERKRQLQLEWQKSTQEKFAEGTNEKQQVAQAKERKRLDLLDSLQENGGLFTDADQVQLYLDREGISDKVKQQRLKKEVQFVRESSTTLPSNDPLLKIQISLPSGKRRDKSAQDFG